MIHWYVRYNGHGLTIQFSFMVNVHVCGGFGSNGFVIIMQPFPIDGHYRTSVISCVGHPRSDAVMLLVLCMVRCAVTGAPALYYRSLETTSTLLRMSNISDRPYCLTMTITLYHIYLLHIHITCMINYHLIMLYVFYK
jgi:hypothetical protein